MITFSPTDFNTGQPPTIQFVGTVEMQRESFFSFFPDTTSLAFGLRFDF